MSRGGEQPRQVHSGMKGTAEQQRNRDSAVAAVGGQAVDRAVHGRRVQVQEAQAHVETGTGVTDPFDERMHGRRRARVTAAVCHGEEGRHAAAPTPEAPTSTALSTSPTSPAASVFPPAGSMSRKLPVCRFAA